jgi:hypothetical protein
VNVDSNRAIGVERGRGRSRTDPSDRPPIEADMCEWQGAVSESWRGSFDFDYVATHVGYPSPFNYVSS